MRKMLSSSLLIFAALMISGDAQAMKWQGRRQSTNVIDIRKETKAVNTQMELETARRYLVTMMMMAEKDAGANPDCVTLSEEIEKLKTVRIELEAMGTEPVRRLICSDEGAGSRVNLCGKILAKDPASAPAMPDLKEFEDELTDSYGPAMDQVGRVQAALNSRTAMMSKEDLKCRATLQLIQRKAADMASAYSNLQQSIQELIKLYQ